MYLSFLNNNNNNNRIVAMGLPKYHCRKCEKKKKRGESNCGNGITEIGGDFSPPISAIPLPQLLSPFFFFTFSAMVLPK